MSASFGHDTNASFSIVSLTDYTFIAVLERLILDRNNGCKWL